MLGVAVYSGTPRSFTGNHMFAAELLPAAASEINVVINVLLNRGWRGTAIDLKQTHVDWSGM